MQVYQKTRIFLDLIKDKFGGNISYIKSQDSYYYESTSFGSAMKVINYLDKYHLLSSNYVSYIKWRKVYHLYQTKDITAKRRARIIKLKSSLDNYLRKI